MRAPQEQTGGIYDVMMPAAWILREPLFLCFLVTTPLWTAPWLGWHFHVYVGRQGASDAGRDRHLQNHNLLS